MGHGTQMFGQTPVWIINIEIKTVKWITIIWWASSNQVRAFQEKRLTFPKQDRILPLTAFTVKL